MIPQSSSITPEALVAGCRNLVSLPESCMKIRTVLEEPNHSREDLADLILFDTSLSARVLRIVNSAYYGLPNRIGQISSALGIIGEHDLNNLILVTSITGTLAQVSVPGLNVAQFWSHSLMNGVLSRQIAERRIPYKKEQMFIAGLLLDVGQLVLYRDAPGFREEVLSKADWRGEPEYVIEQDLVGFDHADVGGELARLWRFPDLLIDTVSNHHRVERSSGHELECKIVNLADEINRHLEANLPINDLGDSIILPDRVDLLAIVEESQAQCQEIYEAFFGR